MPRKVRRFSRETKLAAVRRMLAGENVMALSKELNVLRKDLYKWRASFLAGGPDALRAPGRPRQRPHANDPGAELSEARSKVTKSHRRIAELERKIERQQVELESIRKDLLKITEKRGDSHQGTAKPPRPYRDDND
jgi:transposase-like protein